MDDCDCTTLLISMEQHIGAKGQAWFVGHVVLVSETRDTCKILMRKKLSEFS